MPEDLLIGFDFISNDRTLAVLDDRAQQEAADRLASDIAYFEAIQTLVAKTETGKATGFDTAQPEDSTAQDTGTSVDAMVFDLMGPDDFLLG
ncbi:MAG: hypothetical protein R3D85_09010 [Paracoccaceae bacterium]